MSWDNYFKEHDDKPAQVFKTVMQLLQEKNFEHAEAAIKGYLVNHRRQAEPWMYEWLVQTGEALKRPKTDILKSLGYAALLAKKTKNPNDLIRVADMMVVRNLYGTVGEPTYETNIGELIDMAAEKVPANAIPPMMSVNLAAKLKDPNRMADAAERLLSLGWPGFDDKIRKDLKQQIDLLDKALRDDGKTDEAETLNKRVATAEIRDIYVSLKWVGEADIDLAVEEPLGATARYQTPRTVFGGALIKNGYGKHPEEVYVCPRGFDGAYTIRTDTIFNDEAKPVEEATLTVITHELGPDEKRREFKIDLTKPAPVVVQLTGGRRKDVLPFIAPPEAPTLPIADRNTSKGTAGVKPNPAVNPTFKPGRPAIDLSDEKGNPGRPR